MLTLNLVIGIISLEVKTYAKLQYYRYELYRL